MNLKRQLVALGKDGELTFKMPDGSIQSAPEWEIQNTQALVYLVFDCSGSMAGSKIAQAKRGALNFAVTAFSDGYKVGLISFSDMTSHLSSPVDSLQKLAPGIDHLQIQGSTNLAPAIEEVVSRFKGQTEALRTMVIVTDGMTINPEQALRAAENAKMLGITIMTIGTNDADPGFLSRLASQTDLARQVTNTQLEKAITDTARMLPRSK